MIIYGKIKLRRECYNCQTMFIPETSSCHLCDKCKEKSKINRIIKQREFYKARKKRNQRI